MTDSEFTLDMLRTMRRGLDLYLQETDRYLDGRHTTVPMDWDSCCEYHLERWKRLDDEQKILQARRDTIVSSLRTVAFQIFEIEKKNMNAEAHAKHVAMRESTS